MRLSPMIYLYIALAIGGFLFFLWATTADAGVTDNKHACSAKMNFTQALTCYKYYCAPTFVAWDKAKQKRWCARVRKEAKRRGRKLY